MNQTEFDRDRLTVKERIKQEAGRDFSPAATEMAALFDDVDREAELEMLGEEPDA